MPLRLPDKLPAIELLKHENIFVMDESRAHKQEIRPLKICVLNLMPLKITTETDLVRLLSNTPLQLEVYFMKLKSHTPKNTPIEHMMMFYKDFQELSKQKFDGMIVTGAPIETMAYEEVEYWPEIKEIFDWARTHVTSTLYICWGAQAGLYHFYGVPKYPLEKKMFGIFKQKPLDLSQPIFRGFDDVVELRFGFRYGFAEFFNFRFAFGSVFQQRFVDNDFFLFQYKCFPDRNTGRRNNTFHSWHLLSDYCNSEKNFSTEMSNGGLGYTTPAAHFFEIILPGCPTDRSERSMLPVRLRRCRKW